MSKNIGHFVNGKKVYNKGKSIKIFNPSNDKIIGSITCASKEIVEKTILSSQNAFYKYLRPFLYINGFFNMKKVF